MADALQAKYSDAAPFGLAWIRNELGTDAELQRTLHY